MFEGKSTESNDLKVKVELEIEVETEDDESDEESDEESPDENEECDTDEDIEDNLNENDPNNTLISLENKVRNFSSPIEVSTSNTVTGRTNIEIVLHEIQDTTEKYNENGISWFSGYVEANKESAKGMPLVAQFYDEDMDMPLGHGDVEVDGEGNVIVEDSVVVGVIEDAYIDSVEIYGEIKKVFIGKGYVYNQRYPNFVEWLKQMKEIDVVNSSVEIGAKKPYKNIIYKDGWKETGRVPMIYDYTGHAILSVKPADSSAILLEINSAKLNKKQEVKKMEENKVILELNSKIEEKTNEINEVKSQLSKSEVTVAELNKKIEEMTTQHDEQAQAITEVNEALVAKSKELDAATTELNELRTFKKEISDKELVAELNEKLSVYNEEEKAIVKEKIETFSAEPSAEAIKEIVSEINSHIASQIVAQRKEKSSVKVEVNTKKEDIHADIYDTKVDVVDVSDIY